MRWPSDERKGATPAPRARSRLPEWVALSQGQEAGGVGAGRAVLGEDRQVAQASSPVWSRRRQSTQSKG